MPGLLFLIFFITIPWCYSLSANYQGQRIKLRTQRQSEQEGVLK